jgi:hypothetical protein
MIWQNLLLKEEKAMQTLLKSLQTALPALRFSPGETFYWSPETKEVFYREDSNLERDKWSLLHETGHAMLGHDSYNRDVVLLQLEMAAWDKALELAKKFGVKIDEEHIQDCLDTYRDWLHARSICPSCTTKCLQQPDNQHYRCHNCHTTWKVTPARFARPYRSVKSVPQKAVIFASEV